MSRGGKAAVRNSSKKSLEKRVYKLVEMSENGPVITNHAAFNKGPAEAAAKIAKRLMTNKTDKAVIKITITKVSPGRNQGAFYDYKVTQSLVEIKPKENVPKGVIIEKGGKKYKMKRHAEQIAIYTPTMMKAAARKKSIKNTDDSETEAQNGSVSDSDSDTNSEKLIPAPEPKGRRPRKPSRSRHEE